MTNISRSYLEHVAISVNDINWYIDFFVNALDMEVREVRDDKTDHMQVWVGGIQLALNSKQKNVEDEIDTLLHLGLFTEDLDKALEKVYSYEGVTEAKPARNWFRLPNGLVIELMQACQGSVAKILEIDPR